MPTLKSPLAGRVAALLLWMPAPALAHDTWLLPARFAVPVGSTVRLDLTSAMRFPAPETPVSRDRLAVTGARIGGQTRPLAPKRSGAKVLELSATLPASGIAALWVESRPRTLTLKGAQVEEYLDEIGASATVRSRWKSSGRWRESYRKMAKTFVRVGEGGDDRSWAEPVGMALEIVPGQDPTALHAGDVLSVRVLHDGKGLPGFSVGAVGSGSAHGVLRTTDQDGTVAFTLDRAGPWLIKGTLLEESKAADTDWESLFTTLTLSAGAPR
jgi:uncharacterized GH25 family protein